MTPTMAVVGRRRAWGYSALVLAGYLLFVPSGIARFVHSLTGEWMGPADALWASADLLLIALWLVLLLRIVLKGVRT